MQTELISVIVPIYRVEEYLENCIQSIQNQSYKNLEVLLINDGSPDKCGLLCDAYAKTDSRVRVIHKKNGGLSRARNTGLDISIGDYIVFVDSDDYVHPLMIETLYNNLIKYHGDISVCMYKRVNDLNYKNNDIDNHVDVYTNIKALENLFNKLYLPTVLAWNKLYKRSLFQDIRYPEEKLFEDEFTTYKLIYKADKIIYSKAVLYYYLQRENSITKRAFNIRSLDATKACEECFQFMYSNRLMNLFDKALSRYLDSIISGCIKLKKHLPEKKELLLQLKTEYKYNYDKYIPKTQFSRITRLRFKSFFIHIYLARMIRLLVVMKQKMEGICS